MAKETVIRFRDDLDGAVLEENGVTVQFAFDGRSYEIDLSAANQEKMREAFAPFVNAGRLVSGRAATKRNAQAGGGARADRVAIRDWARANGFDVSGRGRLSNDIIDAFNRAH